MFVILHVPTKQVRTVYAWDIDIEGEYIWFLVFSGEKWDWLDAKECVPYVV